MEIVDDAFYESRQKEKEQKKINLKDISDYENLDIEEDDYESNNSYERKSNDYVILIEKDKDNNERQLDNLEQKYKRSESRKVTQNESHFMKNSDHQARQTKFGKFLNKQSSLKKKQELDKKSNKKIVISFPKQKRQNNFIDEDEKIDLKKSSFKQSKSIKNWDRLKSFFAHKNTSQWFNHQQSLSNEKNQNSLLKQQSISLEQKKQKLVQIHPSSFNFKKGSQKSNDKSAKDSKKSLFYGTSQKSILRATSITQTVEQQE